MTSTLTGEIGLNIDLPFLNSNTIISNIDSLIKFYKNDYNININDSNRKQFLFEALNGFQNSNIPFKTNKVLIEFSNEHLINKLLEVHMIQSKDVENNKHVFQEKSQAVLKENFEKSFKLLDTLFPDLSYIFNMLIGTIFAFKVKGFGGGSVSSLIGLIWLNPVKNWNIVDLTEQLYHEFIHNAFFLDDMIHRTFPDPNACATEDALVISAIRRQRRPLDRSYHAACVAIGLMHYYHTLNDDKKASSFIEPIKETLNELQNKTQYMGERGIYTLEQMIKFINTLDYDSINQTLKLYQQTLLKKNND